MILRLNPFRRNICIATERHKSLQTLSTKRSKKEACSAFHQYCNNVGETLSSAMAHYNSWSPKDTPLMSAIVPTGSFDATSICLARTSSPIFVLNAFKAARTSVSVVDN